LSIDLPYVMTESWYGWSWWALWQDVVLGTFDTAVLPDTTLGSEVFPARRAMFAQHVRGWIDKTRTLPTLS
jgi:hypothetical protein